MTTYHFQLGDFQCMAINEESRRMDAARLFASRSAEEREQILGAEIAREGIPVSTNILCVNTGTRRLLVDSGMGTEGRIVQALAAQGIQPGDIDHVLITHGHIDHVGGLADLSEKRLIFPNARYAIPRAEWEYWTNEDNLQPLDETRATTWRVLRELLAGKVDLFEPGDEILPGIQAVDACGHSPGMVALLFESRGERLLHIADTAHHPFQIKHTDWVPRFDMHPEGAAQARQRLFARAAAENLLVMAFHFSHPGLGHVRGDDWLPLG